MIKHADPTKQYIAELEVLSKKKNINTDWTIHLKQGLSEFKELYPDCSYDDVVVQFGSPEEILSEHLTDDVSSTSEIKHKNILIPIVLTCICVLMIFLTSFIIYKVNQINIATNEYIILDVSEDSSQ